MMSCRHTQGRMETQDRRARRITRAKSRYLRSSILTLPQMGVDTQDTGASPLHLAGSQPPELGFRCRARAERKRARHPLEALALFANPRRSRGAVRERLDPPRS